MGDTGACFPRKQLEKCGAKNSQTKKLTLRSHSLSLPSSSRPIRLRRRRQQLPPVVQGGHQEQVGDANDDGDEAGD